MSRNVKIIIAIVAVIIVAGGAYAIFHNSSNNSSTTNTTSSSNNSSSKSNLPDVNNSVVITKTDSKLGKYLADPQGNALYTYNSDTSGASNCTGGCLAEWPAYVNKGSTSNLPAGIGSIKRSDNGQNQYTFNGMPLYFFKSDSNGQVTGDGIQNFAVARPATPQSSSSTSPPNSSGSSKNSSGSSSGYPY